MTLLDILSSPWAIVPDKLLEIQAIYASHLRGDKIDVDAIEARLGRPLANEQKDYRLVPGTGVAVLELQGVIAPKANMFTRISGGAVASLLQQQVQSMAADPKVKAVVLDIDSPGGNVLGIPALAQAVRALADTKPTVTVCSGMLCSAAYFVGSAAGSIYASGTTDMIGSIGVVATHNYTPAAPGGITTEITAGRYKRMASDREPLSAEGRAYLQAQIDEIYRVFVDAVADSRGVSADTVLEHMADGRVFVGQQALASGLIDGFATVDQIVEQLDANPGAFARRRVAAISSTTASATPSATTAPAPAAVAASQQPTVQGNHPMPSPQEALATFKAEQPEAAALLVLEGSAQERSRIQAVREQVIPGHEALIERLAFDGSTTGPEAAVQVLAAERTRTRAAAEARTSEAIKPVESSAAPGSEPKPAALGANGRLDSDTNVEALDAAAKTFMAANPGTDYLRAIKAVQATQQLQGA